MLRVKPEPQPTWRLRGMGLDEALARDEHLMKIKNISARETEIRTFQKCYQPQTCLQSVSVTSSTKYCCSGPTKSKLNNIFVLKVLVQCAGGPTKSKTNYNVSTQN